VTLFRIALRNVLKNRRRSAITILAVAFGFTAVGVFRGYMHDAYQRITLGAVFLEGPGHLVVFKRGFLDEGRLDPARYLFSDEELDEARKAALEIPGVRWAAPKLALSGLVTNGQVTTIFLADAMDPGDERQLWEHFPRPGEYTPPLLPDSPGHAALLAPKLAKLLGLEPGDDAVLMATTREGQMNAVDVVTAGHLPALADALDDKYLKIPLGLARQLYDFDGADRLCVLLSDASATGAAARALTSALTSRGLDVEIRTWDELSLFYERVTGYLDTVFLFLFTIVVVIVVSGTFNTMSMAVMERTREVGTLRALGLKPRGVVALFATEGALLGAFGSLAGVVLTAACYGALEWAGLSYMPPGAADAVAIRSNLVPTTLGLAFLAFSSFAVVSAVLPARRAAYQMIVDALARLLQYKRHKLRLDGELAPLSDCDLRKRWRL
jgi:putative ABC transport system permease protein